MLNLQSPITIHPTLILMVHLDWAPWQCLTWQTQGKARPAAFFCDPSPSQRSVTEMSKSEPKRLQQQQRQALLAWPPASRPPVSCVFDGITVIVLSFLTFSNNLRHAPAWCLVLCSFLSQAALQHALDAMRWTFSSNLQRTLPATLWTSQATGNTLLIPHFQLSPATYNTLLVLTLSGPQSQISQATCRLLVLRA